MKLALVALLLCTSTLSYGAAEDSLHNIYNIVYGPVFALILALGCLAAVWQFSLGNRKAVLYSLGAILFAVFVKGLANMTTGGTFLSNGVLVSAPIPVFAWSDQSSGGTLSKYMTSEHCHDIANYALLGLRVMGAALGILFTGWIMALAVLIAGMYAYWKIAVKHEAGASLSMVLTVMILIATCGVPAINFTALDAKPVPSNSVDVGISDPTIAQVPVGPALVMYGGTALAETIAHSLIPTSQPNMERIAVRHILESASAAKLPENSKTLYDNYASACSTAFENMRKVRRNKPSATISSTNSYGQGTDAGSKFGVINGVLASRRVASENSGAKPINPIVQVPLGPGWVASLGDVPVDGYVISTATNNSYEVGPAYTYAPKVNAGIAANLNRGLGSSSDAGSLAGKERANLNDLALVSNDTTSSTFSLVNSPATVPDFSTGGTVEAQRKENAFTTVYQGTNYLYRYCELIPDSDRNLFGATTYSMAWNTGNDDLFAGFPYPDEYAYFNTLKYPQNAGRDPGVSGTFTNSYVSLGDTVRQRIYENAVSKCGTATAAFKKGSDPNYWGCVVFGAFGDSALAVTDPEGDERYLKIAQMSQDIFRNGSALLGVNPLAGATVKGCAPSDAFSEWNPISTQTGTLPSEIMFGYNAGSPQSLLLPPITISANTGAPKIVGAATFDWSKMQALRHSVWIYLTAPGILQQIGMVENTTIHNNRTEINSGTAKRILKPNGDIREVHLAGWGADLIKDAAAAAQDFILGSLVLLIALIFLVFASVIMQIVPTLIGISFMVIAWTYPAFLAGAILKRNPALILDWAKAFIWVSCWPICYVFADAIIGSINWYAVVQSMNPTGATMIFAGLHTPYTEAAMAQAGIYSSGNMITAISIFMAAAICFMSPVLMQVVINPSSNALFSAVNGVYGSGLKITGTTMMLITAAVGAVAGAGVAGVAGAVGAKALAGGVGKGIEAGVKGTTKAAGSMAQEGIKAATSAVPQMATFMGKQVSEGMMSGGQMMMQMADALGANGVGSGAASARGVGEFGNRQVQDVAGGMRARRDLSQARTSYEQASARGDKQGMNAAEIQMQTITEQATFGERGAYGSANAMMTSGRGSSAAQGNYDKMAASRDTEGNRSLMLANKLMTEAESGNLAPQEVEARRDRARSLRTSATTDFMIAAERHEKNGNHQAAAASYTSASEAALTSGELEQGRHLAGKAVAASGKAIHDSNISRDPAAAAGSAFSGFSAHQLRAQAAIEEMDSMPNNSFEITKVSDNIARDLKISRKGFSEVHAGAAEEFRMANMEAQRQVDQGGSVAPETMQRMVGSASRMVESRKAMDDVDTSIDRAQAIFDRKMPESYDNSGRPIAKGANAFSFEKVVGHKSAADYSHQTDLQANPYLLSFESAMTSLPPSAERSHIGLLREAYTTPIHSSTAENLVNRGPSTGDGPAYVPAGLAHVAQEYTQQNTTWSRAMGEALGQGGTSLTEGSLPNRQYAMAKAITGNTGFGGHVPTAGGSDIAVTELKAAAPAAEIPLPTLAQAIAAPAPQREPEPAAVDSSKPSQTT